MSRVVAVKLAAEWVTDPLWVYRDNGDPIPLNQSAESLAADVGLPADLVLAIDAWDAEFQAVYNPNDPETSGFTDEAMADAWQVEGERLAARLAEALGTRVTLHTARGDRAFGD